MFVVMSSGNPGGVPIDAVDVGGRLHAVALPGRAVPLGPGAGAVHREPRRAHARRIGARCSTRSPTLAQAQHEASERSGDPVEDQPVRDVVPDADVGARGRRHLRTSRSTCSTCTGRTCEKPGTFARNCLLARRLAERDVRYTMVVQHGMGPPQRHRARAAGAAAATSISRRRRWSTDLKQRGLLDDTLVVFGTEFGRTSFAQGTLKSELRPRSPRRQLQRVDGRRRRQGGHRPTARPTTSATTSSRTRCTSTT